MSTNYFATAELRIMVTNEGDANVVSQAMNVNVESINLYAGATRTANEYTASHTYLIRRLAMDLRMLSIGLNILQRELKGQDPVLDAFLTGLTIVSAAATATVGAFSMLRDANILLIAASGAAKSAQVGLQNVLQATTFGISSLALVAAAAAVVIVGIIAYEAISGISAYRAEIAKLERELEDLKLIIEGLKVSESGLTAQTAALQAEEAALEQVGKMRGYQTQEEIGRLAVIKSAIESLSVSQKYATAVQKAYGVEVAEATYLKNKDLHAIEDITAATMKGLLGYGGVAPIPAYAGGAPPEEQLGGEIIRTGMVRAERGEVMLQKDQVPGMMGDAGGALSVSISMAGAQIYGIGDLEAAFRSGVAAIADEARKKKLMRVRTRSRY